MSKSISKEQFLWLAKEIGGLTMNAWYGDMVLCDGEVVNAIAPFDRELADKFEAVINGMRACREHVAMRQK